MTTLHATTSSTLVCLELSFLPSCAPAALPPAPFIGALGGPIDPPVCSAEAALYVVRCGLGPKFSPSPALYSMELYGLIGSPSQSTALAELSKDEKAGSKETELPDPTAAPFPDIGGRVGPPLPGPPAPCSEGCRGKSNEPCRPGVELE